MYHASGAEEEQRLERRMRGEMEHRGGPGTRADRREHEAQLADGRIGEHLLDVALGAGGTCGSDGGETAKHHRDYQSVGRSFHDRPRASQQEHAGGDHSRGVDERRDRRGALHRVGKPDVERELCGLAHGAYQEEQRDRRHGDAAHLRHRCEDGRVRKVAHLGPQNREREEQTHVTHARRQERLHGRRRRSRLGEPEADQQVRARAYEFPPDEQAEKSVGDHEHRHGCREERDGGEIPRQGFVGPEVAVGEHDDEKRDESHYHEHQRGQSVDGPPHCETLTDPLDRSGPEHSLGTPQYAR